MAILKKALLSLAILTQGINAKAETTKQQVSLEQILKSSEEAAKKVASKDWLQEPETPKQKEDLQWLVLDKDFAISNSIFYTLPNGFRLDFDGHIRGKGFKWKINDDEFYYKGTGVLGYINSFKKASYEESILLGDKKLGELIDSYNNEDEYILDTLGKSLNRLENNIIEKYKDKYSNEFMTSMFWYLLEILPKYGKSDGQLTIDEYPGLFKELSEFTEKFYNEEIDPKDQDEIEQSVGLFLNDINLLLGNTETGKTIKLAMDDPDNNIYIGNKSLGEVKDMFGGLGEFVNLRMSKDKITADLELKAAGNASSEWGATYHLKRGDKNLDFNHGAYYSQAIYAKGFLNFELKFTGGRPLYLYFTENGSLKLFLESMEEIAGLKINIPNMNMDAKAGYIYNSRNMQSESFELSEQTKTGSRGIGNVLSIEQGQYIDTLVTAKGELNTVDWYAKATVFIRQNMSQARYLKDLIYVFDEGIQTEFWHYSMIGAEYYDTEGDIFKINNKYEILAKLGEDTIIKNKATYYGDNQDDQGLRPSFNIAMGSMNKPLNPFFIYRRSPYETLKIGAMLELPHLASRFALKTITDDMDLGKNGLFIEDSIIAETSFTLFDNEGNKKAIKYYVRTEQDEATPKVGNINDQRNTMMKFYSELDGLLVTAKIVNEDYLLRSVWAFDSDLFAGVGYSSNLRTNMHAGELTAGHDRFSLTAGYGVAKQPKSYSRTLTLSAAGTLSDKAVYLDLHTLLGPFSEESRNYYTYNDAFRATLNIAGPFDEIEPLEKITKDIKAAIEKQKKSKK